MAGAKHARHWYDDPERKHELQRREREQAKADKRQKKRARERERRSKKVTAEFGEEAYSACGRKVRFESRGQAEQYLQRHSFDSPMAAYRCAYCGGIHLTSHPRNDVTEKA